MPRQWIWLMTLGLCGVFTSAAFAGSKDKVYEIEFFSRFPYFCEFVFVTFVGLGGFSGTAAITTTHHNLSGETQGFSTTWVSVARMTPSLAVLIGWYCLWYMVLRGDQGPWVGVIIGTVVDVFFSIFFWLLMGPFRN